MTRTRQRHGGALSRIRESTGGADHSATYFLAGSYLVGRGLYSEAAPHFEALSRLARDSPAPHEALGNIYDAVGLSDLAATEYQKALELTIVAALVPFLPLPPPAAPAAAGLVAIPNAPARSSAMKLRIPALALAAASLAAGAALATTVVHMDTRALATRSADIVIGRVTETRSYWDESKSRILTEVRVRVDRRLTGEPAEELVLIQLGGELDGFRYEVPGSPAFSRGEEALVFAWRDPKGRAQVNGLAQGKFEVRRDAAEGDELSTYARPCATNHSANA